MKNPGISALNKLMQLVHNELGKRIHTDDEITPTDVLQIFRSEDHHMYSGNMDTYIGNPVGSVINFMGIKPPRGYLLCDGSEYLISDYPALAQHMLEQFDSINHFGGDGESTFAVPDLTGRFLLGANDDKYPIGMIGGEEKTALSVDQLPNHPHVIDIMYGTNSTISSGSSNYALVGSGGSTLPNRGGLVRNMSGTTGNAHNNMPPYYALLFCIKAVEDILPSSQKDGDS